MRVFIRINQKIRLSTTKNQNKIVSITNDANISSSIVNY